MRKPTKLAERQKIPSKNSQEQEKVVQFQSKQQ
jgi:hypothetical protein